MGGIFLEADEDGSLMLPDFSRIMQLGLAQNGTKVVATALMVDPGSGRSVPTALLFEVSAAMQLLALLQKLAEANELEVPRVGTMKMPPAH